MLAKKPKSWQTNQNAGKQTKMLTNKPKFWQTNLNSSKQTKFVCQDFGLFKFKFNQILISHLEVETPFGLVFWLVDVLFWLKSSLWLLTRRWEEASSFGRLWKFLEVVIIWAFMWTFLEHLYNGTLRKWYQKVLQHLQYSWIMHFLGCRHFTGFLYLACNCWFCSSSKKTSLKYDFR